MGELHLDIIVDRMRREFKVECTVGKPQVAYRETIRKTVEAEGKFIRQTGGHGQYGHCWLRLEPMEAGKGFEFANEVVGGVIPKEFINPIQAGVEAAMEDGVVAGYPMVDIKVTVYDGSYHDVDSSEMAFKVAGSMAFKEGAKKADAVLLEPYMSVEVDVPEDTWETLSAASIPAADVSKAWNLKTVNPESKGSFRFPKCSVMRPDSAALHRDAAPSQ